MDSGRNQILPEPATEKAKRAFSWPSVGFGAGIATVLLFGFQAANGFAIGAKGWSFGPIELLGAVLQLLHVLFPVSFGLLVVSIVRSRSHVSRALGLALLAIVIVCGWFFFFRDFRPGGRATDLGTRWRVTKSIGLDELQDWSTRTLRDWNETSAPLVQGDPRQYAEHVPSGIRRMLEPYNDVTVTYDDGVANSITIWFGGGFLHWGVRVGPPSFEPHEEVRQHEYYRWKDGIYGFVDR